MKRLLCAYRNASLRVKLSLLVTAVLLTVLIACQVALYLSLIHILKVYNESMRRLWAREKEFDFICLGHDALDKADKTMITDYIEATDLLLSGQAHGEKGRNALHGGTGYKYKMCIRDSICILALSACGRRKMV